MFSFEFIETDLCDVPENNVFCVDFISNMIYKYCDNALQAKRIKETLQSLDGATIEKDGAFLYCEVNDMDNAIQELKECGFNWEEVA